MISTVAWVDDDQMILSRGNDKVRRTSLLCTVVGSIPVEVGTGAFLSFDMDRCSTIVYRSRISESGQSSTESAPAHL
jgi:hypothetical protein